MSANALGAGINWDEIDVGNLSLDHSQNFFARVHIEHERPDDRHRQEQRLGTADLAQVEEFHSTRDFDADDKENARNDVSSPQENAAPAASEKATEQQSQTTIDKSISDVVLKEQNHKVEIQTEQCENAIETGAAATCTEQNGAEDPDATICAPKNIKLEFSIQKNKKPACTQGNKPLTATPQAYKFMSVYQKRKEEAMQKLSKEDRERRRFHSRPLPDFKACHEQYAKQNPLIRHDITVPVTPKVLKNSREMDERRKKKLEELKKMQPPKIKPRDPAVLREDPFVPKKKEPLQIESKPFRLRSDERLKERKQYDEAVERMHQEKQKQEEEERKKREERERRELRKLTTFKARPNPFK